MKLLDGFRKLLGQAGQAVGAVAGAGVPTPMREAGNAMKLGRRFPEVQPYNRKIEQAPMQPRMSMTGGNLPQAPTEQEMRMQNGQNAQQFVGRQRPQYEDERMVYGPRGPMPLNQINQGESWMNPDKALRYAEAGGVAEDSAFGYTDRGFQPLNAMAPGENWEPMYQLPQQQEQNNPFQRLMRRR